MSKKYRPYLSIPMMNRIVSLLREHSLSFKSTDVQHHEVDRDIIDSLELVLFKARRESLQPAYIPLSDKINKSLGISIPEEEQTNEEKEEARFNHGEMTEKEQESYLSKMMHRFNNI